MDLRTRLSALLADDLTIERELGGGGMSLVFLARDRRLGRAIVIKVVAPELAAVMSGGRFEREIQLAASLQQANIVPLLTAGEAEDIRYYTMPFVEGESLRARLARGPLSEAETISVLRDVARALLYAHERGVVHRDIKPDNVLLSGESAVVTDFGIAKAITAARTMVGDGSSTLTQMGTAIGTPAYMAPEQATGDPSTDHRADLYALGCMAFELLTGTPPFHGRSVHQLMTAHLSEAPPTVAARRPGVDPGLEALVAACLAKDPAERPATAREVLRQLEMIGSGAARDVVPAVLAQRPRSLGQALGIWAVVFGATWLLATAAVVGIGLPSWTVPLALGLAGLGLPAVLITWYVQRTARAALLKTPTFTKSGSMVVRGTMATLAIKASPHVSWRRTRRAGIAAGALLVLSLATVLVLRQFGLGPAASLLASGAITGESRILVAQFSTTASDTSLVTVVAQAMRTA
ncbi:MAG: serine/threonine-protein kinase, partial [Gemmatimonadota bacterium]